MPHVTLMLSSVRMLGQTRPLTTRTEGASDWNPTAGFIPNGTGRQQRQRRLGLVIVSRRPNAGVGGSTESTQATGDKMDNVCQGQAVRGLVALETTNGRDY